MCGDSLICVVDDDESVRQALDGLLRAAGLRVAAFASAEAFVRSEELPSTACLILDLRMPGMDGRELQQRLLDDGHCIPTIIVTAHGDDTSRAWALGAGAVAFMPKPFDEDALLAAIKSALSRH
jgi:two-component system, LuxR family, response regulator FixJ